MLAGALAGCGPRDLVIEGRAAPAEIVWRAFLFHDGSAARPFATALARVEPGVPLQLAIPADVSERAARVEMVGFGAEDVAAIGTPTGDALEVEPEPGRALLPVPRWFGGGDLTDGRASLVALDAGGAPSLGASWLPPCAGAPPVESGEIACEQLACRAPISAEACAFGAIPGPPSCEGSMIHARVDVTGALREVKDRTIDCRAEEVGPAPGAPSHSYRCGPCRVDLYGAPARDAFEVKTATIAPRELPIRAVEIGDAVHEQLARIAGVVPLAAGVLVAVHAHEREIGCTIPEPGVIAVVDPETMEVRKRTPAPPCLLQLVRDPAGAGAIGAFGERGTYVGRFTPDGTLTSSRAVPIEARFHAVELAVVREASLLVVAMRPSFARETRIVGLELGTLAHRWTWESSEAYVLSIAPIRGGVAAIDDSYDTLIELDAATGRMRRGTKIKGDAGSGVHFTRARAVGEGDVLLSAFERPERAAAFYRVGTSAAASTELGWRSTAFHPMEAHLLDMAEDPARGRYVVAALSERSSRVAIGLFDPSAFRFSSAIATLPMAPDDPIAHLTVDAKGRAWASLPRAGVLVRATPR